MELTTTERWILWNQFTILAALDAESAEYYERAKTAIENGFTTAYAWYCGFLTEEVPREVCEEVLEILDMFKAIDNARPDASELDGDDAWQLEFRGFDFDSENAHFSFARFLILQEDKWPEHANAGDSLNSHAPMLDGYRRMLRRWESMGSPEALTEDQLRELAGL